MERLVCSIFVLIVTSVSLRIQRDVQHMQPPDLDPRMAMINCSLPCIQRYLEALNRTAPNFGTRINDFEAMRRYMMEEYNQTQIDLLCQAYKPIKKCFDDCKADPLNQIISGMQSPSETACIGIYEDLKKHMPCVRQNIESWHSACDPACHSYIVSSAEWLKLKHDLELRNKSELVVKDIESTMNQACNLFHCYKTCGSRAVPAKCGAPTGSMLETLFDSGTQSMNNLTTLIEFFMRRSNITTFNPKNCTMGPLPAYMFTKPGAAVYL